MSSVNVLAWLLHDNISRYVDKVLILKLVFIQDCILMILNSCHRWWYLARQQHIVVTKPYYMSEATVWLYQVRGWGFGIWMSTSILPVQSEFCLSQMVDLALDGSTAWRQRSTLRLQCFMLQYPGDTLVWPHVITCSVRYTDGVLNLQAHSLMWGHLWYKWFFIFQSKNWNEKSSSLSILSDLQDIKRSQGWALYMLLFRLRYFCSLLLN
jgi:hypothetical protein